MTYQPVLMSSASSDLTVNSLKIGAPKIITVLVLKMEKFDFTVQ